MSYLVAADLLILGPKELAELAVHDWENPLDPDLMKAALLSADISSWDVDDQARAVAATLRLADVCTDTGMFIDLKIGVYNALPITDAAALSVLKNYAIAIARYRLNGDREISETSPIMLNYREAMKYLDRVAMGQEFLIAATAQTTGVVLMNTTTPIWRRSE